MANLSELWDGFDESARFNIEEFMLRVKQARDPAPLVALVNATQSLLNLMVVRLAQEGVVTYEQTYRLAGANLAIVTVNELIKQSLAQEMTKERTAEEEEKTKKTQDKFLAHLLMGNQ